MLQLEDFVYHALLFKRPNDRIMYLLRNCGPDRAEEALELLLTVDYPKLYNTSIARYAAFVSDESEPRGLYSTREEAWDSVRDEVEARVVDVPLIELNRPRYHDYYSEVRKRVPDLEDLV